MFYCDTKRDIFSCFPKLCTIYTRATNNNTENNKKEHHEMGKTYNAVSLLVCVG